MEKKIAEAEQQALVLATRERNSTFAPQLAHLQRVVLSQRLLEEANIVVLDQFAQPAGVIMVQTTIRVDEELDVRSDGVAHGSDTRGILADHADNRAAVAVTHGFATDGHLQSREALRDPQFCCGRELGTIEEAESKSCIHRHPGTSA